MACRHNRSAGANCVIVCLSLPPPSTPTTTTTLHRLCTLSCQGTCIPHKHGIPDRAGRCGQGLGRPSIWSYNYIGAQPRPPAKGEAGVFLRKVLRGARALYSLNTPFYNLLRTGSSAEEDDDGHCPRARLRASGPCRACCSLPAPPLLIPPPAIPLSLVGAAHTQALQDELVSKAFMGRSGRALCVLY
jgi:hypothetical protein